ncbi:hypothetical protein CcCBS67573_g03290 [Chytriomyces confervae]|uniref:Carrier domain-containing protein n=1 Tax=Chytriomyces confervae TaxID=246404 RepID=A0A507FK38_9FUNG|nr:hypothetical protein CcCBS67573_g03290 [Chytriomyces confervae]
MTRQLDTDTTFATLLDLLQDTPLPAIRSVDGRSALTHHRLRSFVESLSLQEFGLSPSSRVGILLPESPELGCCIVAMMAVCCVIPINYHLTDSEVVLELQTLRANAVIVSASKENRTLLDAVALAGVAVLVLEASEATAGNFRLSSRHAHTQHTQPDSELSSSETLAMHVLESGEQHSNNGRRLVQKKSFMSMMSQQSASLTRNLSTTRSTRSGVSLTRNNLSLSRSMRSVQSIAVPVKYTTPNDHVLILRTSGTSGNKKTVPYTLRTLVLGAKCVADSWGLGPSEVNLNMMPLYHIGGIVRNLLAPILSGGTVIITTGFDAVAFWDILQNHSPTWYFAVPTMHMAILDEGARIRDQGHKSGDGLRTSIRMIANAGGGLPHNLAVRLRTLFQGSTVLPSYGMTECMPIATPPLDYKLEKPGTSGVSVGPEIVVMDAETDRILPSNAFGRIMVRGPPLFHGYEGNDEATAQAFTKDGYFDTGDMGHLDKDGYLFITGRSKEVINRGGEIISPVEIEDAVLMHPKVQNAAAFSVPHQVLQETVGVIVVSRDDHCRVGLKELHRFLADKLHPTKWPQLIVYMNDVPKNQTNKPLRVKLAERMNFGELDDTKSALERSFEAVCPPKGTALTVPISTTPVLAINGKDLISALRQMRGVSAVSVLRISPGHFAVFIASDVDKGKEQVQAYLATKIHEYQIPSDIFVLPSLPKLADNVVDEEWCLRLYQDSIAETLSPIEMEVVLIIESILGLHERPSKTADFFEIGGNSLTAAKTMAVIRGKFGVRLAPMTLFQCRTAESLSKLLILKAPNLLLPQASENEKARRDEKSQPPPAIESRSPTSFAALLVQSMSILILRPLHTVIFWLFFAYYLSSFGVSVFLDNVTNSHVVTSLGKIFVLMMSASGAYVTMQIILPTFTIACKWLIIGRYKRGKFPLWGSYYLRWWLVDQVIYEYGMGVFETFEWTKTLYFRLMGAKIGSNVLLRATALREFDLVEIHSNCSITESTLRPFGVEAGLMVLDAIVVESDCVINRKSCIAPGTIIPQNTALPPRSTAFSLDEADPKYRVFATSNPTWSLVPWIYFALFGLPITAISKFIGFLPWMACIYWLVQFPFFSDASNPSYDMLSRFAQFIMHQCEPYRIGIHILASVVRFVVCPFVDLGMVILVKRLIIGKFEAGQRRNTPWELVRHWTMQKVNGHGALSGVYDLLGRHYSSISAIYRAMGAKVGERVYWPGTPLDLYEYDLLEVGNDVVFGSRSSLMFSDSVESRKITIEEGAMLADRCVVLPGVVIGKNAMIGTGTLLGKNGYYPPGSTWIGAKNGDALLWDAGDEAAALKESTIKPFGKAFYQKKAPFNVLPEWAVVLYNCFCTIVITCLWTLIPIGGLLVARQYYTWCMDRATESGIEAVDTRGFAFFILGSYSTYVMVIYIAFTAMIVSKWLIIGKRVPGSYDWDKSNYCQRWQAAITTQMILHGLPNNIRGSQYLVWYFHALGATIGDRVCLYPTGADPMMTEPELVTIGDHTVIDCASVVAHINSKGYFSINALKIGRGCVLKTEARLLSGAEMEDGSQLMEQTLVVGGEIVHRNKIVQGWPSREMRRNRKGRLCAASAATLKSG